MQEKTHWNPGRWANSGSRDWTHAPAGIREVESCPHIEKGWRRPLSALQQLRIKTSPLFGLFGPSGGFGLFGYKLSQRMRSCLWRWSFRRRGWSSCRSWRRLGVGAPCNKQSLRSSHRLKVGKKRYMLRAVLEISSLLQTNCFSCIQVEKNYEGSVRKATSRASRTRGSCLSGQALRSENRRMHFYKENGTAKAEAHQLPILTSGAATSASDQGISHVRFLLDELH